MILCRLPPHRPDVAPGVPGAVRGPAPAQRARGGDAVRAACRPTDPRGAGYAGGGRGESYCHAECHAGRYASLDHQGKTLN